MKNFQFGYTLPKSVCDFIRVPKIRVYYSGQNLLTFTGFSNGFDPEAPAGARAYYPQVKVNFVPVDHCIELRRADGSMDNRCDGCLFYRDTIIFVELKQRKGKGNQWIKDGEQQLRSTIGYFEQQEEARNFPIKKAYIANSEKPLFRTGQAVRMERFFSETNYILRIENRINIE